jgi:release factor glutamine methyltransferase
MDARDGNRLDGTILMTGFELLTAATARLLGAGIENARAEAEWLLAHVLGTSRTRLRLRLEQELDEEQLEELESLLARRETREPLAYVLGEWGFRRLVLKTDARALVPRPETEIVVERVLALLEGIESPRVLDVGVGSGAIALALKDERPDARIAGVDISPEALALARENAELLGLDVELRIGGIEEAARGWDLVVSNPPYVDSLHGLQPELHHEPDTALLGEGLHEEIAARARTRFLVLEVGDGQAGAVAEALRTNGYRGVTITRDLAGSERVVEGRT